MNTSSANSPNVKRESKNKIRVDFERTSFFTRFRLKFLTGTALGKAIVWIFRFVLLLGISYVILQPFYTKIASSLFSRDDFVDLTVKLIPRHPTLDTYKAVIEEGKYLEALTNTALLSFSTAVIQTFICSLIGYGFAKYKFKGSKLLFVMVVLTMIVPHKTLCYAMFRKFRFFDIGALDTGLLSLFGVGPIKLTDSFWPLIILSVAGLGFKNGLYIFMMRQFFRGVPDELEESAYIDGYGPVKTFFKIIIPISIPMMITIFLFAFSWQWTDNFYVTNFVSPTGTGPHLLSNLASVVPSSLDLNYAGGELFKSAIRNTAALLILAPLIVVYLFCQRYLVQGIERSGIVG